MNMARANHIEHYFAFSPRIIHCLLILEEKYIKHIKLNIMNFLFTTLIQNSHRNKQTQTITLYVIHVK